MSEGQPVILYIEDNDMNWRLVRRLLSRAGYEMHWAEDGLIGCEMASALKPAMILLDINLPGLSGFEVATKLRKDPALQDTIIVALTAKTLKNDKETALVTGCDGFIAKPIDPFLFVGQVEAYLGGQRDKLDMAREGPALRQFSQQVVAHLESQLREAQDGNKKLLEAQAELEQRSHHLSRLLVLSRDIILIRDVQEIEARVFSDLCRELSLHRVRAYRLDGSGAYYQGHVWTGQAVEELEVMAADQPLVNWARTLDRFEVITGEELRFSQAWGWGSNLGFWGAQSQGFIRPLRSRTVEGGLWGFLAGSREGTPFLPIEIELADLHAGILRVSLENADLIAHLEETSRALGNSYEGLESTYEALKEAQRALRAQDQQSALGSLFLSMAQRLQVPVKSLIGDSGTLAHFMDQPGFPALSDRVECHRVMDRIRCSITEVDNLVTSLVVRSRQSEAKPPEWLQLHLLLSQEVEIMRTEQRLPLDLPVEMVFRASRDLLFGVSGDFSHLLGNMISHSLGGNPSRLFLRTSGGDGELQLELEDNGGPIDPESLATAFEPFLDLRKGPETGLRQPGVSLPGSAQLVQAYGGKIELLSTERGSLLRLTIPMS
jgi:CheY-like chemotaxis protein/signal transduction histidine kinase